MALTQISTDGIKNGTITGTDLATNVDLVDNQKLRVGTSQNLEIYNISNTAFLAHTTGGIKLSVAGGSNQVQINKGVVDEHMAKFIADGAVELYYDNSKKFETLTDGVKISGKTLSLINPSNFQDSTFTLEHGSSTVGNKHTIDFKDQNGSSTQIISYGSAFGSSKDNALEIKTSTTSNGDPTTRLTFFEDGKIQLPDNGKATFGAGDDLQIYHDGSDSYLKDAGTGQLLILTNEFRLQNAAGNEQQIAANENGAVELFYDGSKKFETTSTGATVTGDLVPEANDTRALGTGSLQWAQSHIRELKVYEKSIHYDNVKALFGHGEDLEIYHSGSHSYISDNGTGNLKITSNGTAVQIEKSDGENMAVFRTDGSVELYHDNSKKFETTSGGISVAGDVVGEALTATNTNAINLADSKKINLGNSSDLQLYYDGSDGYVQCTTTGLRIESDQTLLRSADSSETYISTVKNGAVELYYDNSKKFETSSSGATVTGTLSATNTNITSQMFMPDNGQIRLGNNDDLLIFHNGTDSVIRTDHDFKIEAKDGGKDMIHAIATGAVELHHNGSKKLHTTSSGITVTGSVTETSDIALKSDIQPITNSLEKIQQITGCKYNLENSTSPSMGVIAQDVEKVFPELVHGSEGNKTLQYSGLIGVLIEAVKDLSAQVAALKTA